MSVHRDKSDFLSEDLQEKYRVIPFKTTTLDTLGVLIEEQQKILSEIKELKAENKALKESQWALAVTLKESTETISAMSKNVISLMKTPTEKPSKPTPSPVRVIKEGDETGGRGKKKGK